MQTQAATDELRQRTVEAVVNHTMLVNNNAYLLCVDCPTESVTTSAQAFCVQVNVGSFDEATRVSHLMPMNVVLDEKGERPEFLYLDEETLVVCDIVKPLGKSQCSFDFRQ